MCTSIIKMETTQVLCVIVTGETPGRGNLRINDEVYVDLHNQYDNYTGSISIIYR